MKKNINNRSLGRALQILCAFTTDTSKQSLSELADRLALSKSTVYRLCVTMVENGFLKYDDNTRQYSLGLKLFHLGAIVSATFSLRQIAAPHLIDLQQKTGKSILLGVLHDGNLMYLDKREDVASPIRFSTKVGMLRQPYFGMLGQTLLAYLPDDQVDRLLDKNPLKPVTQKSIRSKNALKQRLAQIRQQNFVIEEEEVIDGVAGVAAPVFSRNKAVAAAVGLRFILSADSRHIKNNLIRQVRETAEAISADLGYEAW